MVPYFRDLVDGYNQAKTDAFKSVIYDAMVEFTDAYHPGYVCYDMDMYIALYKYATTSSQRKHALKYIQDIIADDAFQDHFELIDELKQFVEVKSFLDESDLEEFDAICKSSLDLFKNTLEAARNEGYFKQFGITVSDDRLPKVEGELKEICKIIISTDMRDLMSYQEAVKTLVSLGILSREYISRLFSNGIFFSCVFW